MKTVNEMISELKNQYIHLKENEKCLYSEYRRMFTQWEKTEDEELGKKVDKAYEAWKEAEKELYITSCLLCDYVIKIKE